MKIGTNLQAFFITSLTSVTSRVTCLLLTKLALGPYGKNISPCCFFVWTSLL